MAYIPPNPNGIASAINSAPVATAALSIIGTGQSSPALNYEYLTNTSNGWYDALGYSWLSLSLASTGGGGTASFECTNDPVSSSAGISMFMQNSTFSTPTRVTQTATTGTLTRQFEGPITARYIRVRQSLAGSGTIVASATLRQSSPQLATQAVSVDPLPTGTNSIGTVLTGITSVTDISNTAYSSSTTTSFIPINATMAPAASFAIDVTAVSGTSPTLDVNIQESGPNNLNHIPIYQFERVTATGSYYSPTLRLNGTSLRYGITVGGTSPSFTITVYRIIKSSAGQVYRCIYDRTLTSSQALNATTASLFVQGSSQVQMIVSSSAATTPCAIQLQGSADNASWFAIGSPLSSVASTTVATAAATQSVKYIRGIVTTAGSGQTLNYVHLVGQSLM